MLHVGAMKTGTTYLQNLIHANAEQLGAQGWWVPSQRRVVRAVRELMALTDDGHDAPHRTPLWAELMDEARAHTGIGTVISMEFLSYARPPRVQRVITSARGLDLRVVLTVRDAVRALPSQWQSLSRNGHAVSWPDFAGAVRASGLRRRDAGVKAFRRTQDIPRMVEVWSRAAPRERFAAVTVPASSETHTLLWDRFLSVVGVDPATTTTDAPFDNPQLGYGSCELLRRLNAAGLSAEKPSAYRRVVRRLSREELLALREEQSRPHLDRGTAEFALGLNGRTRAAIKRYATLVGDLDDLPTRVADPAALDPGPKPAQVDDVEVRRAAERMYAGALALCADEGHTLPPELTGPLPGDLDRAVRLLAAVMGIAITGDVSHRPRRRSRLARPSTLPS